MNNKLKIYARETKNGKEYNHTQLVSVSSPVHKSIPLPKSQVMYSLNSIKQDTENEFKFSSIKQKKPNSSYEKYKQLKSSIKMNKSLDFNHIADINSLTCSINQYQSKTPKKRKPISKEKIEASINILIELKKRISQLNNQIDIYEEEHNTIFSFGEEKISELKNFNSLMTDELKKAKEGYNYFEENNQLQEKKRTNDMLKNEIEVDDNNINCLKKKLHQFKIILDNNYNKPINSLRDF